MTPVLLQETEHHRLEESLRQAEERYRLIFEQAPVGIASSDRDGRFISVNDRYCALLGYSRDELIGRRFAEFSHPDDAASSLERYRDLLDGTETTAYYQRRYIRKDGSVASVNVALSPMRGPNGEIDYVICYVEDMSDQRAAREKLVRQARLLEITEIRRAEDELREHKLQLAEAQEIARLGSWTHDFITGRRQWSEELCKLTGVSSTPTSAELHELIHPGDLGRFRELERMLVNGLEPCPDPFRIVNAAGVRTVSLRCRTIRNEQGEPLELIGVVQDVTEMKAAEDELRRHAILQSAVADLGHLALSGASVRSLLDQTAISLREILGVDLTEILEKAESRFVLVAGAGWDEGEIGVNKPGDAAYSQASYTVAAALPVIVEDIAAEERFVPSELLGQKGLISGLTVAISSGDGTPWGVLGVHSRQRRPFTAYEIDFLRSVATVLGQAIDRAASDAEVRTRGRQQSAIASLGRLVLTSVDNDVLDHACELLRIAVDADFAFINELTDENTLRYRAGKFWYDGLPEEIAVDANAQAGLTILGGEPVLVDDYSTENRFDTAETTVPHGILSGLMVPIASATRTFGVLSAQSRRAGHFRSEDIDFLQAIANMLAEAMEREGGRAAMLASEHRYCRIFDGASEIIFTIDRKGNFVTLNPAFASITGWTCDEWRGRSFWELIAPSERQRMLQIFTGMTVDHGTVNLETTLLGKDREVIIEVTSFPNVEHEDVTEVYGFGRDVTEARRAMGERERVTRSLELLLESTAEGIYTIDMEGRCTMVNRAAAAFLGVTPHDLLGVRVHELLHPFRSDGSLLPEQDCIVHDVLRTGEPRTINNGVFRRKDGVQIPVAYSAAPIVDGDRRVGAVITFSDLTERRKLEIKLEQANRLSSLGRLAATVAHEFNNVLMGIAPFVEVLRRAPDHRNATAALDHIGTSVQRGRRITQDILSFTQPAEPVRTAVELDAWLGSIAAEARSLLPPAYDVVCHSEPLTVEADSHQLHQIFTNLILNARDAMPQGGTVRIEARRERADAKFAFGYVDDPGRYAHLLFSDTGCGIAAETLQHIFEPLFTTKKNGIGLGLAVTHQVVQLHGGEIFIESTEDAGSTFHIFLPLRTSYEAPEPAGEAPHYDGGNRILLVEDDAIVAAGLIALLELEGFSVTPAATGNEALAALRGSTPDAVVLDIGLPDMDGRSVYAAIAETNPMLPVILSTGHADRAGLEDLLVHPNVQYLLKPYDTEALMAALARAMTPVAPA